MVLIILNIHSLSLFTAEIVGDWQLQEFIINHQHKIQQSEY